VAGATLRIWLRVLPIGKKHVSLTLFWLKILPFLHKEIENREEKSFY